MHISLTRLKLRSPLHLFAFVRLANRSVAQAQTTRGFQIGALLVDQWFTFWTVTGWDSLEAMKAYRDSGAHREAMPKLLTWCDEASVAQLEAPSIPDWPALHKIMVDQGRSSRVSKPSRHHREGFIPPIRPWFPARPFKASA